MRPLRIAARPSAGVLLLLALLGWLAAAAGAALGAPVSARAVAAVGTTEALDVSPELALYLFSEKERADDYARRRCEVHFLDFVELMWPVLDPGMPFCRGKVQEAIALHLEAVTAGKIRHLLANVPPGSTKTYLANIFWPAWEWGPRNRPDLRYMTWSYSDALVLEANDKCRIVIKHPVYQRLWGDRFQLDPTTDAKGFFRNSKGGWRRSSSVGGASTGFRADRLIFDDPHNVKDADSEADLLAATRWFSRSLPTRIRSAGGASTLIKVPRWVRDVHGDLPDDPDDDRPVTTSATVGIMQRVHLHDISGIILKNPALGYEVLLIEMRYKGAQHPARLSAGWRTSTIGYQDWRTEIGELADPIRQDEAEVARLEYTLALSGGNDAAAAQLDQWPLAAAGSMFKIEWLPIIEPHEVPRGVDKRGWDWASSKNKKADQTATACTRRAADKKIYLMDSEAIRGGPLEVEGFIRRHHRDDPRDLAWSVPRDPGATGELWETYVARELAPGRYVHGSTELGKIVSARPVSAMAARESFVIVRHPGCETTRAQLVDFPYGDHDDLVDAISRSVALHFEHGQTAGDGDGAIVSDGAKLSDSTPLGFDA